MFSLGFFRGGPHVNPAIRQRHGNRATQGLSARRGVQCLRPTTLPAHGATVPRLREHATLWGLFLLGYVPGSRDEGELVPKMVWRVKLVAELEPGLTTEVEVARLERDEQAGLADLGLRLAEAKQLTAALQ